MKARDDTRKISVRIWSPLLRRLNDLCGDACLNRDAYLDAVLAHEAVMLRSELNGRRNSDAARSHIRKCLVEIRDLMPVSISLRRSTAESIDHACLDVNVWRDVFINRVAYLLVADTKKLGQQWGLDFDDYRQEVFEDGWEIKTLLLGPRLQAVASFIKDDPFGNMRSVLHAARDTDSELHLQPLGMPGASTRQQRGLLGFSTFLEDAYVPGTSANQEHQDAANELLAALGFDEPVDEPTERPDAKPKSSRARRAHAS